jgi:hypothetical protein
MSPSGGTRAGHPHRRYIEEEAHGKHFFSNFVTALCRAMSGFSPRPGVVWNITETEASDTGTSAGGSFAASDVVDHHADAIRKARASGNHFAFIDELYDGEVFNARLVNRRLRIATWWKMWRSSTGNVKLQVEGRYVDAKLNLALLTAACLENPDGQSPQNPLTIRFVLRYSQSVRVLGDLLAPLRYRAESLTVTQCASQCVVFHSQQQLPRRVFAGHCCGRQGHMSSKHITSGDCLHITSGDVSTFKDGLC